MLLCSCGNATATVTTEDGAPTTEIDAKFTVTEKGVDAVAMGADIKSLPEKVADLYDSIQYTESTDEVLEETVTTAEFYMGETKIMEAYAHTDGKIICIDVTSPEIPLVIDGKAYKVGGSISEIAKAKGVKVDDSDNHVFGIITINPDLDDKITSFMVGSNW